MIRRPSQAVQRGLDHHGALGDGPGIADRTGSVGGADQEDEFLGPGQSVAGNGGVAVMEGLEAPDENQVVVVHENPSRSKGIGSIPQLSSNATPAVGRVKGLS